MEQGLTLWFGLQNSLYEPHKQKDTSSRKGPSPFYPSPHRPPPSDFGAAKMGRGISQSPTKVQGPNASHKRKIFRRGRKRGPQSPRPTFRSLIRSRASAAFEPGATAILASRLWRPCLRQSHTTSRKPRPELPHETHLRQGKGQDNSRHKTDPLRSSERR